MKYDFESWREYGRALFEPTLLGDRERFFAHANFAEVGDVRVGQWHFSSQLFEREPRTMRDFDPGYLLFERYYAGQGNGVSDASPVRVAPDVMHLVDLDQRYRSVTGEVRVFGVWMPYARLGYRRGVDPAYASLATSTPRGQVLADTVDEVATASTRGATGAVAEALPKLLALIRSCMLDQTGAEDDAEGAARLVRNYIARNLNARDLGAGRLCHDLGLSRSALYRLFEEEGGVRAYIQDERLKSCLEQLMNTPARRGEVRRIAQRWGFADAANFNRGFRRRFGCAPSDCLLDLEAAEVRHDGTRGSRMSKLLRTPGNRLRARPA